MFFNKVQGATDSMLGNFRAQFYNGSGNFYHFEDTHPVQAMNECYTLSMFEGLGDCGLEIYVEDVNDYRKFATYDSSTFEWHVDPWNKKKD